MEPNATSDVIENQNKTSLGTSAENPIVMFTTKARQRTTCERLYFYNNHEHIRPKLRNPAMHRGSFAHKVLEVNTKIRLGEIEIENLDVKAALDPSQDRATIQVANAIIEALALETVKAQFQDVVEMDMAVDMSMAGMEALRKYNIIKAEETIDHNYTHNGWHFRWRCKADSMIINEKGELWQGEYKTTKSYSTNMQRLYHRGIQPWIYQYVLRHVHPELQGIMMFILTKKPKNPKPDWQGCYEEQIKAHDTGLLRAERYIYGISKKVADLEAVIARDPEEIFNDCTQCVTFMGECPYWMLCEPKVKFRGEYYNQVIEQMFMIENPEAHLEE